MYLLIVTKREDRNKNIKSFWIIKKYKTAKSAVNAWFKIVSKDIKEYDFQVKTNY
jgi:hypothetical protein